MKKLILMLMVSSLFQGICHSAYGATHDELARYHAPIFYQDIDTKWENHQFDLDEDNSGYPENGIDDFITRFDFDGDFLGYNNWKNLSNFEEKGLKAYVYYSVAETQTHWFVLYGIYHPRDWDDEFKINWMRYGSFIVQHENDLEGVLLVIRKDGSKYGVLEAMCTMAHQRWFNYPISPNISTKTGYPDDRQSPDRPKFLGRNPIVFVQSEGHGIYADKIDLINIQRLDLSADVGVDHWDETDFPNHTGVIYFPAQDGVARTAIPMEKNQPETHFQSVGYELLTFEPLWWRRNSRHTFTPDGAFVGTYDGYDDLNPLVNNPNNDNHAHAPWGWRELRSPLAQGPLISEPGEIWYDPARFIWPRFQGFERFDLAYTPNNPSWIKPRPIVTLEIVDSDSLGPNLVVIDKDVAPTAKLSWDANLLSAENIHSISFLWNGREFDPRSSTVPSIGLVYYSTSNNDSTYSHALRYYVRKDGYLIGQLTYQEGATYINFYSNTLWVKVQPHRTAYYVDQKKGDDKKGQGSPSRPWATIGRALDYVEHYWEALKKYRQTITDTIFVRPGVYQESPRPECPVHLIGSGAHHCVIGEVENSIIFFDDEFGQTSSIQNFRITRQISAYRARVKISNNVFTPENWGKSFIAVWGSDDDWAILMEECSSYLEITNNTFEVESALVLTDSDPKIYNNLFTEKCNTAIWGRDEKSWPTISGKANRANSFLGSQVYFLGSKRNGYYNWWGTADPEELKHLLGEHVDYSYFLKSPPENVGAQIPAQERGDFDANQVIWVPDFISFINHFGTQAGDPNWNPLFDLNFDGQVDAADLKIFLVNFGHQLSPAAKQAIVNLLAQPINAPYLFPPFPNPANSQVQISFFVPEVQPVSLKIYNLLGQAVRELVNEPVVGKQLVVWDSRNAQGQPLASGIYFCRLATPTVVQVQPITLVH